MSDILANRSAKDRRKLDFYPTPPDVTHALMQFLNLPRSKIWECACGEGHMAKVIEEYGHKVIATDIRHTGYGIGGRDFLQKMNYWLQSLLPIRLFKNQKLLYVMQYL